MMPRTEGWRERYPGGCAHQEDLKSSQNRLSSRIIPPNDRTIEDPGSLER